MKERHFFILQSAICFTCGQKFSLKKSDNTDKEFPTEAHLVSALKLEIKTHQCSLPNVQVHIKRVILLYIEDGDA